MTKKPTLKLHPFVQAVRKIVTPVITHQLRKIFEENEPTKGRYPKPTLRREVGPYYTEVNRCLGQLTHVIDNLKLSLFLMQHYPHCEFDSARNLSHRNWIHYHYSAFVNGFVSTYDIALLLTNIVFRLGIPESKCRNDVVRDNSHVQKTRIHQALGKFDKVVNPYRPIRHANIHRGVQPHVEEVFSYEMNKLIKDLRSERRSRDVVVPQRVIRRLSKRLNEDLTQLENGSCILLDALHPVFREQAKHISS